MNANTTVRNENALIVLLAIHALIVQTMTENMTDAILMVDAERRQRMPRYIDADALKQGVGSFSPVKYTYEYGLVITVEDIDSAPTADVVEKEQYDRLLENATIISEALNKYQNADVVERKRGKWIIKDNPGTGWYRVTCSECGEDVTSVIPVIGFFPNAKPIWNFCPDCGSDNREETEDEMC